MRTPSPMIGDLIRDWRRRRRLSQLDLACEAEISTRHLSFVETGRAAPSRDMVLRLAGCLEAPLRVRNQMLLAAGYAPEYPDRPLGDPGLGGAREGIERLLRAHEPFPALAVDRCWNLQAANGAVASLMAGAAAELLAPPVNVLRLSLHPRGLAPRIDNLAQWRAHLLHRLRRQVEETADPDLDALLAELLTYPAPAPSSSSSAQPQGGDQVALPLRLRSDLGLLSFWSATLVFGGPLDVTLAELTLETFLPADAQTGARLAALLGGGKGSSGAGEG
jgi:transcriptional regulator with XRE-family HTH domain